MMNNDNKGGRSLRALVSMLLLFSFLALVFTGILFLLGLPERGFLGLDKEGWEVMHINAGVLVLIATVAHILLNWKLFWGYLKRKDGGGLTVGWPLVVALGVVAVVMAGTALDLAPFDEIGEFHERMESAAKPSEQPAELPPHAVAGHGSLSHHEAGR
jgi:hypothetical protein